MVRLALAGEFDLSNATQVEDALKEIERERPPLLVLDLRELTFMDRAGAHVIVNASVRARQLGRRLVLLRGSPNVDRMFALTGSSEAVEIGDLDLSPREPPIQALQRSLVSSSLLRTG